MQLPADPAPEDGAVTEITEEAAITSTPEEDFRVEVLVAEGEMVAQGAPLLRDRRNPEIQEVAPMPGRVAAITLGPGRRLTEIRLFREPSGGRHEHAVGTAGQDDGTLRALLMATGLWRLFRARPFGAVPAPGDTPAAIFVMALDTRPLAADPRRGLRGAEADFERGLDALARLTAGRVYLCQARGADLAPSRPDGRLRIVKSQQVHPWGMAGLQVHRHCPAALDRQVWDIAAQDVAAIGCLLQTGLVPETRLVSVAGPALQAGRLVRCQPGADLRALCYGHALPGPYTILSGSALDGRAARWLRPRDRQVTALAPQAARRDGHWFLSALHRAARPLPLIPTAALEQALGGAMPAIPFLRALAAGDAETATRLGALSLLPEDLALADYVSCAEPGLSGLLAGMLARLQAEEAA